MVEALGNKTRQANKVLRRERILKIAMLQIATSGYEEFTLSKLAAKAGVSSPTIHNLFGKKDDMTKEIANKMMEVREVGEVMMASPALGDPIKNIAFTLSIVRKTYEFHQDTFRAAMMIADKTGAFNDPESIIGQYSLRARVFLEQGCTAALAQGYLLGNIETSVLADSILHSHRRARQDWVLGHIDFEEYCHMISRDMLLTYAADASPECYKRLCKEIKRVSSK